MSYRIDAVVLAAGESTRAGEKNKLLLRFHTKTLISHDLKQALAALLSAPLIPSWVKLMA